MSEPTELGLGELIELSPAEIRRSVREGRASPVPSLVEAIRGEAGRFYHGDAGRALRIARVALALGELSGDPVARGWGHRAMGEALIVTGRLREAEAHYEKGTAAWRSAGVSGPLGQLLVPRIHLLALLGRYAESEAAAAEARRILEAAGDFPYLAKLAMNLGNVHFQREHYRSALREYEQAAVLFAQQGIRDSVVMGLEINRGTALSQIDREEEALALFARLSEECAREGHDLLRAQVRMNAAYVHSQRADFDIALRDLGDAEAYFRRTEHPSFLAACLLNRAEIYHQLNLHRDSLSLTEEAEPLFAREGLVYDRALAAGQSALSRLALGRNRSAISGIRRARALFEREANEARVAWAEMIWAEALASRRRAPGEAERRARRAIETFSRMRLVRWEAAAAVLLARLAPGRAEDRIERFRGLLGKIPQKLYPMTVYRLLEALGGEEERAGRSDRAAASYRRALHNLEDLRIRIPTEVSKIAFLHGKTHIYDRLLALELRKPRPSPDRLLEWVERSKAQSLWDRLRLPADYLGGGAGGEPLDLLRRRLSWLHGRLSRMELGTAAERRQLPVLRRDLRRAEEAWSRALRESEERGSARGPVAERIAPESGRSLRRAIRDRLPEGWGLLHYYIGSDFSLVLGVTRSGGFWRSLAPDAGGRLRRLADRLDLQWSAASLAGAAGRLSRDAGGLVPGTDLLLSQLHRLLWRPVEEASGSDVRRWVISPHGPVHRIPIHALRDRGGYLIERTDFAVIPSGRILREIRTESRGDERTAWIGGVPSDRLPGVAREVERVTRRLPGYAVETDLHPSRQSFAAGAGRSRIVHLAAHGALRSDNPAFSYLELADGPLLVQEVRRLRLPGSMVVLSTCSSGRGDAPVGDEWIGLARAFLQAGASSVLASLWPIHEDPTLDLMDRFYERIASGEAVPEAIGAAMRGSLPLWPHPWAWAPFALLGGV